MTNPTDKAKAVKCNYCGEPAEWVANKEVYGKNYGKSYMIWLCRPCNAYVGCHNNTKEPKGTLANEALRKLRVEAKELFIDKKMHGNWDCRYNVKAKAYRWLMRVMGLKKGQAHIGMFNEEKCQRLINLLT